MASFWNNLVNKIAGVEESYDETEGEIFDGEYDEGYGDMEPISVEDQYDVFQQPEVNMAPTIVPIKANETQVVILQPDSIRSSQQVCDHIRQGHTVICNIENVDRSVAQRVIDYISGAAYSIDGNVKPIDQNRKTFVVAPRSVSLMDREMLAKQEEAQNAANNGYRQVL